MPGTHVALLRGINVGKAKRIAMADLRALVEAAGYRGVRTLLNSGNVVFAVPTSAKGDPAPRIEQGIVARVGFTSKVTVLSAAELAGVIRDNPFAKIADNPSCLFVAVLKDPADRSLLAPLIKKSWKPDLIGVGKRAAYMWCPRGMMKSELAETAMKVLGEAATTRNWATITKLQALLQDG